MKYRYLCLVPFLCLGACSVVNEGPNKRIDNVDNKLGTVEEKVDALLAYNNKTYDILVDNELRIAELEKDARKRGVPTPQKGPDITSLSQMYDQRVIQPNPSQPIQQQAQAQVQQVQPVQQAQQVQPVQHDGRLQNENAQAVQKQAEVGAISGQNLSAPVEETNQQAVKENVVEAPQQQRVVAQNQQNSQVVAQNQTTAQQVQPQRVAQPQKVTQPQQQTKQVQPVQTSQQVQPTVQQTQVAQVQAPVQKTPQARMTSSDMYNNAYELYQNHEYAKAEKAFDAFLAQYPNDVLSPNALYWKGETLYARGIYPQAIYAFKEVQARFPTHPKTADSLLKTAMSYARLGDSENASLHYLVLVEDWGNSDAARKARNMGAVQ